MKTIQVQLSTPQYNIAKYQCKEPRGVLKPQSTSNVTVNSFPRYATPDIHSTPSRYYGRCDTVTRGLCVLEFLRPGSSQHSLKILPNRWRKGEREREGKKTLCLYYEAFSLFNYFLSFYVSFSHIRDFHRKFDRITVIRMIFYSHLYVIALNCGKESTFKFIEYKT